MVLFERGFDPNVSVLPAVPPDSAPLRRPRRLVATPTPRPVPGRSTQFHVLSFEGPDGYARAGGIASRITGLAQTLAAAFDTHLWFVGDPELPGASEAGALHLHRWCQWISRWHPLGVYDGEDGKQSDYASSLPPFLLAEHLLPHLEQGGHAVVMAEEWHTVHAVLHLDWLLRRAGGRHRVTILWNANNLFGFERIDWRRLQRAAVVTTVSRYMKHRMAALGIEAVVIPNGLAEDAFAAVDPRALAELRRQAAGRTLLAKVARWDPDKRWLGALHVTAELKQLGLRPLLVARGGIEAHGHEVLACARMLGLEVAERAATRADAAALLADLAGVGGADIVNLRHPLDPDARRLLFRAATAVLANSSHEPFGLVGLETMAAGGIACTGCSGEEYAIDGRNAVVLHTTEPKECVGSLLKLRQDPGAERALRRAGRLTARQYAWQEVLQRHLLPRLELLAPGQPLVMGSRGVRATYTPSPS